MEWRILDPKGCEGFFFFPVEKVKRDTIDIDKKQKSSGFVET